MSELSIVDAAAGARNISPGQTRAYRELLSAVASFPIVHLLGEAGTGKTTLARMLADEQKGVIIRSTDIIESLHGSPHPGYDEHVYRLAVDAIDRNPLTIIEDADLLGFAGSSQSGQRGNFWSITLQAIIEYARTKGRKLCFTLTHRAHPDAPEFVYTPRLMQQSFEVAIPELGSDDYAFLLDLTLQQHAGQVDAKRVFAFAPMLTPYQLMQAGVLISRSGRTDPESVRDIIEHRVMQTNVDTAEVADIEFSDLKGFEEIADALETHVINPLLFDERFDGLDLKPVRGVLLYGPPGTGKTSVGRALAKRMKGKFFLVDGTFTTEPPAYFYSRLKKVFHAASQNTPSVIFIDDADVLFQSDRSTGLSRYLLTMLDGLESETAGKVAVIMTAMDPNHMPPAVLRSGRVELWLETRLPNARARGEIVAAYLQKLPAAFHSFDTDAIVKLTEGFNSADLRRLVNDVKALYARDVIRDGHPRSVDTYLLDAANAIIKGKAFLAQAAAGTFKLQSDQDAATRRRRLADEGSCGD